MRPIDADALIEKFNEKASIAEALMDETKAERFRIFCLLADAVEQMPTVDAVPVVRCQECKKFKTFECPMHYCNGYNDFCSFGERLEG